MEELQPTDYKIKRKFNEIDIDAPTTGGVTPLMLAVKAINENAVNILLDAGANPCIKDKLGQDATQYMYSMIRTDMYASDII